MKERSSSSNLVSLEAMRLAPVPEVVELLREHLERAKSGEIRGIVIGSACAGGADATAYCLGDAAAGIAVLVLATERARARLLEIGEEEE